MGTTLSRVKIGLYVLVIILVGALFVTRVYNALQKTTYLTQSIIDDGNVQIQVSYPARILSPKNDIAYPITVSFLNRGNIALSYEVQLASPTLLFVDAKGGESAASFQFDSAQAFVEKTVYVRPFLSGFYPQNHGVTAQVLENGNKLQIQPVSVVIKTEPQWLSFLSFASASLLEISIASALVTWIANALDAAWNSRKERISQWKTDLSVLISLPLLEQMSKFREMKNSIRDEHLEGDLQDDLEKVRNSFSEREFLQAVGNCLHDEMFKKLSDIEQLYEFFQNEKNFSDHKISISALAKILDAAPSLDQAAALSLISSIMKLWDDFDADAKDLIVGALKQVSQKAKPPLSEISGGDLSKQIFKEENRRRLLRDAEIQAIFPQLSFPVGYDAVWRKVSKCKDDSRVIDWLKQHSLISNPFGSNDLKSYPFYPDGFARPYHWEDFLSPVPLLGHCPTVEDARSLAFLLRTECLPKKSDDEKPKRQIFPIWVSFDQTSPGQLPLPVLAHCAARTWLDILAVCPDAMLDLSLAEQRALLELLCWSAGSNDAVVNLLKRSGLKDDKDYAAGWVLIRKITEFENKFPSSHLPQDIVLLSWLKVRPPELTHAILILPIDEFSPAMRSWWLEQFNSLISTLFLNGIVTKIVTSTPAPAFLSLPEILLRWSDAHLKSSIDSQFEAAIERKEAVEEMGISIRLPELFGPGITEEQTTHKLISASRNSLARMCMLGNRLLQTHCEKHGVSDKYLHLEDLDAILNAA